MANISDIESEIKIKVLWETFEDLKAKTLAQKKDKRKNLATAKATIFNANNNERVLKECKFPIGKKAFNQAKKGTPMYELKDKIEKFKVQFPTMQALANNKTREAIESIDSKLRSNEEANVELMLKQHILKEEYVFLEEKYEKAKQDLDNLSKKLEELYIENRKLKMQLN